MSSGFPRSPLQRLLKLPERILLTRFSGQQAFSEWRAQGSSTGTSGAGVLLQIAFESAMIQSAQGTIYHQKRKELCMKPFGKLVLVL